MMEKKRMVYADNAATTRLSSYALEAMLPWLRADYANASQPYSFSRNARKALSKARACVAECIGADPEEIVFTSGGTESDNWVIKNSRFLCPHRQSILTSQIEHHAILRACEDEEKFFGRSVLSVPVDGCGHVDCDGFKSRISNNYGLVSIMTINNEIGTIQPVQELCSIAHEFGCYFHTDAVQAVGHIDLNVKDLGVDFLSASAHKFNGPKGIGFLYIRKGVPLPSLIAGGKQELGMRAGTENVAAIVGMAAALQENIEHLDNNRTHISSLEQHLMFGIKNMGIERLRNGHGPQYPGIISLSFKGKSGESILHRMDLMGICISTGSACDSNNTRISHVINALNLDPEFAKGTIRISLSKDNTFEDIDIIVDALGRILST